MPSKTELKKTRAFSWSMLDRAAKALRLQVASDSTSRKAAINSEASGINEGECWKIEAIA